MPVNNKKNLPALRQVNSLSSVDRATALIRDRILDLTLPPGSTVSYQDLVDRLQLSRTPIRDALSHLAVEEANRGVSVAALDLDSVN